MYLCLCKGLTDNDVRDVARTLAADGVTTVEAFLDYLDLDSIEACGLCADDPEAFVTIALSEWAQPASSSRKLQEP